MTRRFEQELQKLQWHHVLPIGPYGIQPFVQPGHGLAARAGWRLAAGIGASAQADRRVRTPDGDRHDQAPDARGRRTTTAARAARPPGGASGPSRAAASAQGRLAAGAGSRAGPPERTETIEAARRHHRETIEAYLRTMRR